MTLWRGSRKGARKQCCADSDTSRSDFWGKRFVLTCTFYSRSLLPRQQEDFGLVVEHHSLRQGTTGTVLLGVWWLGRLVKFYQPASCYLEHSS